MTDQKDNTLFERRKHPRMDKEFVVRVTEVPQKETAPAEAASNLASGHESSPDEMTGKNISEGGVAIEAHTRYPAGRTVALEIFLPELKRHLASLESAECSPQNGLLRFQCEVMWSKQVEPGKFDVGLRFLSLGEDQAPR